MAPALGAQSACRTCVIRAEGSSGSTTQVSVCRATSGRYRRLTQSTARRRRTCRRKTARRFGERGCCRVWCVSVEGQPMAVTRGPRPPRTHPLIPPPPSFTAMLLAGTQRPHRLCRPRGHQRAAGPGAAEEPTGGGRVRRAQKVAAKGGCCSTGSLLASARMLCSLYPCGLRCARPPAGHIKSDAPLGASPLQTWGGTAASICSTITVKPIMSCSPGCISDVRCAATLKPAVCDWPACA